MKKPSKTAKAAAKPVPIRVTAPAAPPARKWRNRIVGHGEVDAKSLLANPKNWRIHPKNQVAALAGVLSEVGWVQDVIVNQRSGFVVDGHARVALAIKAGEKVPVVYVDLDEREEAVILATLDPLSAMAEKDEKLLAELVGDVVVGDDALSALLAELVGEKVVEGLTDPDACPEVQPDPITVPGDLWLLGSHRLLCGDSTSVDAVERLMNGAKADMVFTDPPYGIDYQDLKGRHEKLAGDSTMDGIASLLAPVLINDCPLFICCNWRSMPTFAAAMEKAGRHPKACIVWDKLHGVQNLDRFYKRHEFIMYNGPFGGTETVDGDVWPCEREVRGDHPTAKPVALVSKALLSASATGSVVLDLFGGSGSTLIACEKTRRHARLMEIAPAYCDVIVRRWQEFSGKKATLDGDNRTFGEILAERLRKAVAA